MDISVATLLLVFALASPGALDQNGGHVDIMTGRYHQHAGPSYQFRYVDMSGRLWIGNGPRPEEGLLFLGDDHFKPFYQPLLVFLAGGFVISAVVIGLEIRKRLGYRRYHRRRAVRYQRVGIGNDVVLRRM